jgi:hypothetical protein
LFSSPDANAYVASNSGSRRMRELEEVKERAKFDAIQKEILQIF